jgi:uncharacterized protein YdaU (DUF1376 family)
MRTGHLMARRFWYPRDPSAFLMATAHYDLETKGAYSTLIDLLNERDRPLPNEDRFISGILGCSPQKWRKIRDLLLRDGKIVLNSEGQITNPRYEREAKARGIEHAKAVEDGRKGGKISAARRAGQAELDLDAGFDDEPENPNNGKRVAKDSQKSCNSFQTPSRNPEEKPNEINGTPQPPPQAPRARENQNQKLYSPPISSSGTNALDRPDLHALMERVCEAAGYRPMNPTQISRSLAFVEDMVKNEIDFDETVIPVVEAEMAKSKEPTRTLGRFRDAILHQQARSKASRKQGQKPRPPDKPILAPDGEAEIFLKLRTELLNRCSAPIYCASFNSVRFVDQGPCHGDRRPLKVDGPEHLVESIRHGRLKTTVLGCAKPLGFTEIW